MNSSPHKFIVVMGVSGCGKTTVGQKLAGTLGWPFYDADDFHSAENIARMRAGIPLTDADRVPWLAALHSLITAQCAARRSGVLACSALKERYRQTLLAGVMPAVLVYLKGSYAEIAARLAERQDHYMAPALLQSQFEVLEEPASAVVVDATLPLVQVVRKILRDTHMLADIGVIGLGVTGKMTARDIARSGFRVAVHDVDSTKVDAFRTENGGGNVLACKTLDILFCTLATPRRILVLVPAGESEDAVLKIISPHLAAGDVVIRSSGGRGWS